MNPISTTALLIALSISFAACEKRPETLGEKVEDKVKDGLDARPAEKLKDAGEDVKDAVKDAAK